MVFGGWLSIFNEGTNWRERRGTGWAELLIRRSTTSLPVFVCMSGKLDFPLLVQGEVPLLCTLGDSR